MERDINGFIPTEWRWVVACRQERVWHNESMIQQEICMEIRAAQTSDIEAIAEVAGRSWLAVMVHVLSYANIEYWVRDGKARAMLSQKLDDMLVAVSDGQLVDFVPVEADTIREIFVRLGNHRQGVGRRLVRAAVNKRLAYMAAV